MSVVRETDVMDITFDNLRYVVKSDDHKEILHSISGHFPSGKLIGILGPSGAGKTTLLNVLSGFECHGVKGCINVNGSPRNMKRFKKTSCYITQDNDLHQLLTVMENMRFAADLKLGPSVSQEKKSLIIQDILKTFGLTEVKDVRTARISGGQMKRLSVCLELISNPLVIFLDEPTTGLDSYATYQCIEYLKYLASIGKTVICTIHQPSAMLFKMFDQVYLLSRGYCLYQGETNQLVHFLQTVGLPCNIYHNPADYAIELASGDHGDDCIDVMVKASENGRSRNYVELTKPKTIPRELDSIGMIGRNRKKSGFYELCTLMKREFVKQCRNLTLTYLRLGASFTNSLAISVLYLGLGTDASKIWFNYNLVLAVIANLILCGLMLTILVFPTEMGILTKEHFNRYYSLKSYYSTITLIDLPLTVLCTLISCLMIYYLTGQPLEIDRIAMFTSTGLLVGMVAQSLGLFIGASMNLQNGIFTGSYIHVPLMLVSGFGMRFVDLPSYFYFTSYMSYLRYAVNGMMGSIYSYNRTKLDCPNDAYCHYTSGQKFLNDMGVEGDMFWENLGILFLFYLGLRIMSYVSMRRRVQKNE